MAIFICWSGTRSKMLADAVFALLESEPLLKDRVFVSDRIEKGVRWFEPILRKLQEAEAGIVCLTAENLENSWLHFEAGALAAAITAPHGEQPDRADPETVRPDTRLFTLLHGVTPAELKGPLSAYQATSTAPEEMKALVAILTKTFEEHDRTWKDATHSNQGRPPASDHATPGNCVDASAPDPWTTYQDALERIAIPVRELVPNLESLFQRKTFNEPVYRCADQAWLSRHNGVRITRERLDAELARVRAACSKSEVGLFEMLLAELDAFGMTIEALLLESKKFELGERGELEMDNGIRTCCEDRRLAIRSLLGRLARPLDPPLREEAVRFMGAETGEERKMIVHRLEGIIRRAWETVSARKTLSSEAWKQAVASLTCSRDPIDFRASSWDLDRIYYYLLIQYFGTSALPSGIGTDGSKRADDDELGCLARDVEMEVERFRAKPKGGSLMPLTYALIALQKLDPEGAPEGSGVRRGVNDALDVVETNLGMVRDPSRPVFVGDSAASGRTVSVRMKEVLAAVIRTSSVDRPAPTPLSAT